MPRSQILSIAGTTLEARSSGALWWEREALLCVSDMHLGKSESIASRRGVLLPPYETHATLDRLAVELERLAPARVICLGDSFDDAAARLADRDAARLASLMAGRDWIWIAGNHDPLPPESGGTHCAEITIGQLTFRHQAGAPGAGAEISGHYHPKYRIALKGVSMRRPCFLVDARRLILPAFGTYTGGLDADHPDLLALFAPSARAILTGEPCVTLPLPSRPFPDRPA